MVKEYKILVLDNGDLVCIVRGQARLLTGAKVGPVKQFIDLIDPPLPAADTEQKVAGLFSQVAPRKPVLQQSMIHGSAPAPHHVKPLARSVELAKKIADEPSEELTYKMTDFLISLLSDLARYNEPLSVAEAATLLSVERSNMSPKMSMLTSNGFLTKSGDRLNVKYMVNPKGHAYLVSLAK